MTRRITPSRGALWQRDEIQDSLNALLISHVRLSNTVNHDTYSAGYSAGYQDALEVVARLAGVKLDIERTTIEAP